MIYPNDRAILRILAIDRRIEGSTGIIAMGKDPPTRRVRGDKVPRQKSALITSLGRPKWIYAKAINEYKTNLFRYNKYDTCISRITLRTQLHFLATSFDFGFGQIY